MDHKDLMILDLLQQNNHRTHREIGEIVGLSVAACQRRIVKLRQSGAIQLEVAILDPKQVGAPLMMIVEVTLERERADIIDRFKQSIRNTPEIMQGYYVTGETDFVLIVSAADMEDYEAFTRKFFYQNPDIKRFQHGACYEPGQGRVRSAPRPFDRSRPGSGARRLSQQLRAP